MLNNKTMIEALKGLNLDDKEIQGLEDVFDERREKVTGLLTHFSEQKEPPTDVLITGSVTLSNISLALLNINPNENQDFTDTCMGVVDTLKEEGIDDRTAMAVLLTGAAMIAGGIELEDYIGSILKRKAREKMKAKKSTLSKTTIKLKKESPISELFDTDMSEEELAKQIAAILKGMDK